MINKRRFLFNSKSKKSKSMIKSEPLLVFTFDDAYKTDYTIAYPLLSQNGIKGTTYVVSDWIGKNDFCSWNQLVDLEESEDWDVQGHTKDHPDLSTLNESELRNQFETVNQAFQNNGLNPPNHLAYPYGATNDLVKQIAGEYRITQRKTGRLRAGLNNRKDLLNMPYPIFNAVSVDSQTAEELNAIKTAIQWGYDTGKVIVLYCHEIKQQPDEYDYSITESNLIELVSFITSLGIRTLTISELYNEIFTTE